MTDVDNLKKVSFDDDTSHSESGEDHLVMETVVDEGEKKTHNHSVLNSKEAQTMARKTRVTTPKKTLLISLAVVLAGVGSGFGLFKVTSGKTANQAQTTQEQQVPQNPDQVEVGTVYGAPDPDPFPDTAQGVLVLGGVEGEGTHRLLRPGGPTQTVALTSSVVDLDIFENHKIKVWGETFAAQRSGWFMDIGRVEVIELNAEKPFEIE